MSIAATDAAASSAEPITTRRHVPPRAMLMVAHRRVAGMKTLYLGFLRIVSIYIMYMRMCARAWACLLYLLLCAKACGCDAVDSLTASHARHAIVFGAPYP